MIKKSRLASFASYSFLSMVIAIVFYALFRAEPFPDYFLYSDKVGHFVAFFLMTFMSCLVIQRHTPVAFIFIVLLSLAVGSEFIQGTELLPNRHFGIEDILANVGGVVVGLVLMKSLVVRRKSLVEKRSRWS